MRTLVKKHLDELHERRGTSGEPHLLGFWGASDHVGSGQLSQWYMSYVDRIKVSPETVPELKPYWKGFMRDTYLVPSAEHAMMLAKAIVFQNNEDMINSIAFHPTSPAGVKALGRKVKNFDAGVWERVRYSIVRDVNVYKFKETRCYQTLVHFQELYKGRDVLFVETSPYDAIWGIKSGELLPIEKWRGDNLLGFAITEAFDIIYNGVKND